MSSLALSFNDVNFDVVDRNGQPWLKTSEVAQALGYADQSGVTRIFLRNKDEFTDGMTSTVKLTEQGQMREIRIFSLRGAHLIAMFARTAIAKKFRKWVLDILDGLGEVKEFTLKSSLLHTIKEDRVPLKDAVTRLIAVTKMMNYPQAYELVHKAFGVDSITEIPKDKLHVATMYVNGLVGEYIPYEKPKTIEVPKDCVAVKKDQLQRIVHHTSYLSDVVNTLYPLLRGLHSPMAGSLIGHMQEIQCCANILKRQHGLVARITP